MSRGLLISLACDFISSKQFNASTTAQSVVFTPADGPQAGIGANPSAIVSEEVVVANYDTVNGVWIRFQLPTNETVSQGISSTMAGSRAINGTGGQSFGTQPITVNAANFIAATAGFKGELYLAPAATGPIPTSRTIHVKAVGISVVATGGTPLITVDAVGAANIV